MADPVRLLAAKKKKPKSTKLYGCPQCSYKANRAYNVQRHQVKHFEKPPKELQHMCQYAGCSFSTLRWDNLNRHIQRVHGVTKSKNEDAEELEKEAVKITLMHVEDPSAAVMNDEDLALIQSDEDPTSMLSDEESASLLSYEIPIEFPTEDASETIPTKNQTDAPKLSKVSKQKDKRIVKPRKNYKSGKSKFYECETCSYRTNRGYNIKRHIAKHGSTELELHVCVISGCGFSTPRWDNLCRHIKRVHSETATPTRDFW